MATKTRRKKKPGADENADCDPAVFCFVRPRFFDGQVLNETDLERLESYIRDKNRFYNRHFHDWGVVCGLLVECVGCDDTKVRVSSGYALSPCGEDIVVSAARRRIDKRRDAQRRKIAANGVEVSICDLLCRDGEPDDPCAHLKPKEEKDGLEDWILSVHYAERPVWEPNPSADSCCRPCPDTKPHPRAACESYEFRLTPVGDPREEDSRPGLFETALNCVRTLQRLVGDGDGSVENLREIAGRLRQHLVREPSSYCGVIDLLDSIEFSEENLESAQRALGRVLYALLFDCFCRSIHPPCPDFEPGGVPLALLSIRAGTCKVHQICHWGHRKLARSLTHWDYWTSPVADRLVDALHTICCEYTGALAPAPTRSTSAFGWEPDNKAAATASGVFDSFSHFLGDSRLAGLLSSLDGIAGTRSVRRDKAGRFRRERNTDRLAALSEEIAELRARIEKFDPSSS